MQHKLDSFSLWLSIENGPSVPLVGADILFSVNAKNTATVFLPVGNWEVNNLPNSISYRRGSNATIRIVYPGLGSTTLFRGVVYDFAPVTHMNNGVMSVAVTLYGRLYWLMTGTLHSGMTVPASYLDANQYWSTATDQAGEAAKPAQVDPNAASSDFGAALIDALEELASGDYAPKDSVSEAIQNIFGDEMNSKALEVLQEINSYLQFRNFEDRTAIIDGIVLQLNQSMQTDWGVLSFYDRIQQLSARGLFSLIENGSTIELVPLSPAFFANDARAVLPDTYASIVAAQDPSRPLRDYRGCVLTSSPSVAQQNGKAVQVVGFYKGDGGGQVITVPVPNIFCKTTWGDSTTSDAPRDVIDIGSDIGNDLAQYFYWENKFYGRTYNIVSPYLRTDIGLLTPLRVQMPRSHELATSLESATIYGLAMSVSIKLDSDQGVASTTIEVGYARTREEQRPIDQPQPGQPTYRHPLWRPLWNGGSLSGN